ncbi:MAG: DUF58 domain-containing protein [Verrucomicrobiae bacterium]|nr:DUF58 domain-containing protein [Verrucomicrobiae bacterium]
MNANATREILKKVRQIEIRTNRLVTETLAGQYHSVFKGRGMDFEEVREYVPGDEVRSIDWNVTARTGRAFVKKFTEERELTILLLVDLSASGNFGSTSQSKRELAAELASVLAFSAIRNNDKVGLILFTDQVEQFIPPKKGRQHVLRVIREILFYKPAHRGTDIIRTLDFANKVIQKRAIAFLISDFQVSHPTPRIMNNLRVALRLTNRRHDLVALTINDSRERQLPPIGLLTLEDSETGEQFEVDTGKPAIRDAFARQTENQRNALNQILRSAGVDIMELNTGESYIGTLMQFFNTRERRRA